MGESGVKKLTIKRKYGFGWKKGGIDVGCGEDYIIVPEPYHLSRPPCPAAAAALHRTDKECPFF